MLNHFGKLHIKTDEIDLFEKLLVIFCFIKVKSPEFS